MSAQLSPEEVDDFLRETYTELDTNYWMEEGGIEMAREYPTRVFPEMRFSVTMRQLGDQTVWGQKEIGGWQALLHTQPLLAALFAQNPGLRVVEMIDDQNTIFTYRGVFGALDPFADEPTDDPPAGAEVEHCGTVTLEELDELFAE